MTTPTFETKLEYLEPGQQPTPFSYFNYQNQQDQDIYFFNPAYDEEEQQAFYDEREPWYSYEKQLTTGHST